MFDILPILVDYMETVPSLSLSVLLVVLMGTDTLAKQGGKEERVGHG